MHKRCVWRVTGLHVMVAWCGRSQTNSSSHAIVVSLMSLLEIEIEMFTSTAGIYVVVVCCVHPPTL